MVGRDFKRQVKRTMREHARHGVRSGRCLCGIKVCYHFDASNRKRTCAWARLKHPRASVVERPLVDVLSTACSARSSARSRS